MNAMKLLLLIWIITYWVTLIITTSIVLHPNGFVDLCKFISITTFYWMVLHTILYSKLELQQNYSVCSSSICNSTFWTKWKIHYSYRLWLIDSEDIVSSNKTGHSGHKIFIKTIFAIQQQWSSMPFITLEMIFTINSISMFIEIVTYTSNYYMISYKWKLSYNNLHHASFP